MGIKDYLKDFIINHPKINASPVFLNKVFALIDNSENNKEGLGKTIEKISSLIYLFIDKDLGPAIKKTLDSELIKRL